MVTDEQIAAALVLAEHIECGSNFNARDQAVLVLAEALQSRFAAGPATLLIAEERNRQVKIGWPAEHDDGHRDSSLVVAGVLIAVEVLEDSPGPVSIEAIPHCLEDVWPVEAAEDAYSKNGPDLVRRLVIAAAFLAAEIDRRIRAAIADAAVPKGRLIKRLLPDVSEDGVYRFPDGCTISYCVREFCWKGTWADGDDLSQNLRTAEDVAMALASGGAGPLSLPENAEVPSGDQV